MNRFSPPLAIDVHQHLWPEPLIEALRARRRPPRLEGWTLILKSEPDYDVEPGHHDLGARVAQAASDGVGLALVSLSEALGIEFLPGGEAAPLLDAYHEGSAGFGAPFGAWAAASLTDVDPAALTGRLADGFAGLQLPANALLDQACWAHVSPLLDVLADGDRPLFIHPGPARAGRDAPAWWPAVVCYVAQMQAAWFAFLAWGRPRHPRLRVCFALLAGLGPLQGERAAARGGPRSGFDENLFLETSSYGPRAIDATVRVLGVDALVSGSDRPYAEPVALGDPAAAFAVRHTNPLRLLDLREVPCEPVASPA